MHCWTRTGLAGQPHTRCLATKTTAKAAAHRASQRSWRLSPPPEQPEGLILVSMGTVITGDHDEFGWEGRPKGEDGAPHGLTGRELCQSAWGGAFDALGRASPEEGPLLVVALGPQAAPLGDLRVPANAVCAPSLPQVDILKAGVDVFLTHGGQNSFMEAIACGAAVVVCPGFGDQPVNALKAEALGVGLQVPRPSPELGAELVAAAKYRVDVAQAMMKVLSQSSYREAAAQAQERLQRTGGVSRAVEAMLMAAAGKTKPELGKASASKLGGA